jgi:hypothetical protein
MSPHQSNLPTFCRKQTDDLKARQRMLYGRSSSASSVPDLSIFGVCVVALGRASTPTACEIDLGRVVVLEVGLRSGRGAKSRESRAKVLWVCWSLEAGKARL